MVLLSASICTKSGKAVVSRQFMEVSRSRIEGLLAAFPKLMTADEQHTFVETENVRYVYQPMESLYMVLITTKNSNILEDLETLRLFAKVVPEYCKVMNEAEVAASAFELISAFDEVIALGYRENVTLAQIRTFTEMDSHEENIYKMVQKNKEREAKEHMKRKAKELQLQKKERERSGISSANSGSSRSFGGSGMSGFGGGPSSHSPTPMSSSSSSSSSAQASYSAPATSSAPAKKPGKGMQLGGKGKSSDFVDALIAEGETVAVDTSASVSASHTPTANTPASVTRGGSSHSVVDVKSVHVSIDEKINLAVSRDGGLSNMEVKGTMLVNISDPAFGKVRLHLATEGDRQMPFQTHPNVDKKLFKDNVVGLKDPERPFPLNSEVGVVKWRFQTTDEANIPLTVNCWPTLNGDGTCDVNIEYELLATDLDLRDVCISIPVPAGGGAPVVANVAGEYRFDSRRSILEWTIPVIDSSNTDGTLEFSIKSRDANDFFPVLVNFSSPKSYAGISVSSVTLVDNDATVDYSQNISFSPERYEVN